MNSVEVYPEILPGIEPSQRRFGPLTSFACLGCEPLQPALAHLIIISVHHAETLPDGVKTWIDLWLGQRNNHNIVLLALFDPVYQGSSSSMKAYLQEVAKRGDMEFLVKSEDAPDCR